MMTAIEIVDNLVLKNLFVNSMPCFRPVHTYTMSLAIKKNKETKPSYAGVKDILLHKYEKMTIEKMKSSRSRSF